MTPQINSAPTPLICYPNGTNQPSPAIQLEDGSGLFALEDGSGVILLES